MAIYKATAEGGGSVPELRAADNSRKILEQGQAYISQLRQVREIEAAQQAAYIRQLDEANKATKESRLEVNEQRRQQATAVAEYKLRTMEQQRKRAEAITGTRDATGNSAKAQNWIKFVTDMSQTAGTLYAEQKQKQEQEDKIEGRNLAALFPHTPDQIGFNHQMGSANIISADAETLAAVARERGASPEVVELLQSSNSTRISAFKYALSKKTGKDAPIAFQESLLKDNGFVVSIDGQEYKLSELPASDTVTLTKAWAQFLPEYFDRNGFETASAQFLTAGLSDAQKGWETYLGGKRQEELNALQSNRDNQQREIFAVDINTPGSEVKAVLGQFNYDFLRNGGDYRKAAEAVKDLLSDTGLVPSESAVKRALDTPMGDPNNPKDKRTFAERFPSLVIEIRNARTQAASNTITANSVARRSMAERLREEFRQGRMADLADNDVIDADPKVLAEKAAEYRLMGPEFDGLATDIENSIPMTADAQNDQLQIARWTEMEANNELTVWSVIGSSASPAVKREWVAKANAAAAVQPADSLIQKFRDTSATALRDRVDFAPGSGKPKGLALHLTEELAVKTFISDYKTARLTMDPQAAYQYAEGRFFSEFQKGDGKDGAGAYALYTPEQAEAAGNSKLTGTYKTDYETSERIPSPKTKISETFRSAGSVQQAIAQPLIDKTELEQFSASANSTGMITSIPPSAVLMSDLTNGKFSPLQILQIQMQVQGVKPLPDVIVKPAQEAELSVNPEMRKFLSKPSLIRTEIAMRGSGQGLVYHQLMPIQRQALDTISISESSTSGNYDAVNQGGNEDGTRTKGYSGPYSKMSSATYKGKKLTDLTIGQLLEEGDPRWSTHSDSQFQAAGGIHAAGRYQIIHDTLKGLVRELNIPLNVKFSPGVQDYLALYLLNRYGDGQWVGPTAADRVILRRARGIQLAPPPWRNTENMSPEVQARVVPDN